MPWSDTTRTVILPAVPLPQVGLELAAYQRSRGGTTKRTELTVVAIAAFSPAMDAGVRLNDVFIAIDGVDIDGEDAQRQAEQLFGDAKRRELRCNVLTPGHARLGKPLLFLAAMIALFVLLWNVDPESWMAKDEL